MNPTHADLIRESAVFFSTLALVVVTLIGVLIYSQAFAGALYVCAGGGAVCMLRLLAAGVGYAWDRAHTKNGAGE